MTRTCGIRSFVLVNAIDFFAATLPRRAGAKPVDRANWRVRASAHSSQ
jgi:hypothetical protein